MILIGFMGSGKTTVAEALAQEMKQPFIDTDEEVEKQYGTTIKSIFEREGESGFRQKEYVILKSLIQEEAIISTGGGIITYDDSKKLLRDNTQHKVFFLNTPFDILYERIKDDPSRPLAAQGFQKVRTLYEGRLNAYHFASDHTIDTSGPLILTLDEIMRLNSGL